MAKPILLIMAIILFSFASLVASFGFTLKDADITGNVVEEGIVSLESQIDSSLIELETLQNSQNNLKSTLGQERDSYDEMAKLMYGLGDLFETAYPDSEMKDYFYAKGNNLTSKSNDLDTRDAEISADVVAIDSMQSNLNTLKQDLNDVKTKLNEDCEEETNNSWVYVLIVTNMITFFIGLMLARDQQVHVNVFHPQGK